MTSGLETGLGLALLSALALDTGFLLQHGAVARAPELSLRRPRAAGRALLASGRWTSGFTLGLIGWGLYFAALAFAPLSLVQTVAAGSIGLLVVLAAAARRQLPVGRERAGAMVATIGLVALAASAGRAPVAVDRAPGGTQLAALALAGAVVAVIALRSRSAALGGLAAGLCYGIGDVFSKALLVELPQHPTVTALIGTPLLYATAGAHGAGFALLQRSFQHGGAVASLAPMTAATNIVPIAAGVLLLGEHVPAGTLAVALRIGAFAAAVAGASILALRGAPEHAPEPATAWLQSTLPTAAG
jgi:hypothetical protein